MQRAISSRSLTIIVERYGRADVLRILRITAKQLVGWERAGLIAPCEFYSFFDLIQLKKVRDLRARRVAPATILRSLQAMQQQVAGMENPFLESGTYAVGRRIAFRHGGHSIDPVAGQFLMDFDPTGRLLPTREPRVRVIADAQTAADFFQRGVALEEDPNTQDEALAMYRQVLALDAGFAAAHINIGTLLYNRNDFKGSEYHYRQAIAADPKYALAYFDLGNVLDETGRVAEASASYRTALLLAPTYADAHYNLALAYEKLLEPRKALKHWKAYVRMDGKGPWTIHARHQIKHILQNDRLQVVFRASERQEP